MNFKTRLAEEVEYIENILKEYIPVDNNLQKVIFEAMEYSLMAGGKRLRPMLMLETCRSFNGNDEDIKPFTAVMEFIHTYSLVHDDLPAMDNDEFRRGRRTTHVVYGEDLGILAGDALLNYAFEIGTRAIISSDKPAVAAKALNYIAEKSGVYGMIGGQVVDVISEGKKLDIDTINYIHNLKTAALIEASMVAGAIIAGADDEIVEKIEKAANNIGIAFQIQDDILDITSTTMELGKPVGSDERNNKDTYVSIKGLDDSKIVVNELLQEATDILNECNANEFLLNLIEYLTDRRK